MSNKQELGKIADSHNEEKKNYIYMLRCQDLSIYTGITRDVKRRMEEHKGRGKKAARYTRTHGFLKLEIVFEADSWSEAARLEYAIKQLGKKEKEELINRPELVDTIFKERLSGCHFTVGKINFVI